MKRYDLHIHSNLSDGGYSVEKIINKAKQDGIDVFSITDHDNVESLRILNKQNDITYIPGVEMSSIYDGKKIHILGYGITPNGNIAKLCDEIKLKKKELILGIIDELMSKCYRFEQEDLYKLSNLNDKTLSKSDIAQLLVKYKKVSSIDEAYKTILYPFKIGSEVRCDAKKVISLIKEDNGIAILAHPKVIEERYNVDIEKFVSKLKEINLDGIEVYNAKHNNLPVDKLLYIAKKNGLLISGGTDFHGRKSDLNFELGYEINSEEISEKILKKAIYH